MKKVLTIIKRALACIVTLSSLAIALIGIIHLDPGAIVTAMAFYFIGGGLLIQSLDDIITYLEYREEE